MWDSENNPRCQYYNLNYNNLNYNNLNYIKLRANHGKIYWLKNSRLIFQAAQWNHINTIFHLICHFVLRDDHQKSRLSFVHHRHLLIPVLNVKSEEKYKINRKFVRFLIGDL